MKQSNNIIIFIIRINYERDGIKISKGLRTLLEHILEKNPKKRYTAKEIVEYPWLNTNI